MAPILTAEDVVRRIAAECAYIDDRGGVFGSNRLRRSGGSMGSNSAKHRGVSVGFVAETAAPPLQNGLLRSYNLPEIARFSKHISAS
jgi:hypothetical protein